MWIEAEKYTPRQNTEAVIAVRERNNLRGSLMPVHAIFMDGKWWPIEDGEPRGGETFPPVFIHPIPPIPKP